MPFKNRHPLYDTETHRLVPVEPDDAMAIAGRKALAVVADRMETAKLLATSSIDFWQRVGHQPANEIFAAMLSASPSPPSGGDAQINEDEIVALIESVWPGNDWERTVARAVLSRLKQPPSSGEEMRKALEPQPRTFWVVERFENNTSAGYWNGSHSRDFQPDINEAIQFCRRRDAMWVIAGWHWKDVQITEHVALDRAALSQTTQGRG